MISVVSQSWIALIFAILFGVMGTISLKLWHHAERYYFIYYIAIFYCISFVALTFALKHVELSIVYAVWSGLGTLLTATIGIIYFNESISIRKIIFLLLIIIGVLGIHSI